MYNKMQDHWEYNGPPVYMAVAGYLGLIKKKPKMITKVIEGKTVKTRDPGNLDELMAMFGPTGGIIQ